MPEALPAPSLNWALFLDVDDTLLDVSRSPESAKAGRAVRAALTSLYRSLKGAVALLSGRSLAELDRAFSPIHLPAAGQHGAELRLTLGGDVMRSPPSPHLQTVRDRLEIFAQSRPGILVADQGRSLIVDFRGAAECRGALDRAVSDALADADDLEAIALRRGFHIKPRGFDDGIAVEWLMRTPAFRNRSPIFVGDSKADRAGFLAVGAFVGTAVRVGESSPRGARAAPSTGRDIRRWLIDSAALLAERHRGGGRFRKRQPAPLSQN